VSLSEYKKTKRKQSTTAYERISDNTNTQEPLQTHQLFHPSNILLSLFINQTQKHLRSQIVAGDRTVIVTPPPPPYPTNNIPPTTFRKEAQDERTKATRNSWATAFLFLFSLSNA